MFGCFMHHNVRSALLGPAHVAWYGAWRNTPGSPLYLALIALGALIFVARMPTQEFCTISSSGSPMDKVIGYFALTTAGRCVDKPD